MIRPAGSSGKPRGAPNLRLTEPVHAPYLLGRVPVDVLVVERDVDAARADVRRRDVLGNDGTRLGRGQIL